MLNEEELKTRIRISVDYQSDSHHRLHRVYLITDTHDKTLVLSKKEAVYLARSLTKIVGEK